jgi:putative ABC transport system permease protein
MMLRLFLKRIAALARRRRYDQEFEQELTAHLELAERDAIAAGISPAEAAREARLRFGAIEQIREAHRDSRSLTWIQHIARDLGHACRSLLRTPRFSAIAVLTLALGIGASTAMFSVVHGVLLRPLPFREPDRLVALYHVTPAIRQDGQGPANYFTYRDHGQVFEDIGLWNPGSMAAIRGGVPEQIETLAVTDGTLPLLGVHTELGRLFGRDDDVPGAPLRALLTYGYWQEAFAGSNDVVGQSLVLNGRSYEVIGVLPASFKLLNTTPQVVLPMRLNRSNARTGALFLGGVARLKPGVTLPQANDDIARMIPLTTTLFPLMPGLTQETWDAVKLAPNVRPLAEAVTGEMERPLWILLGTVLIVLLIAWANVANLLLVRAEARQREFAVRDALGAGRGRIAGLLLSEALVLGLGGGVLGVLFAHASIRLLRATAPTTLPRMDDIAVDAIVLFATVVISIVTSLMFGLIPVLRCRRLNVELLKESGRSTSDAPGRHRTRNILVVAQVALALVLLVISGLMARTFVALRQVHPGFVRPSEVQMFDISLPPTLVREPQEVSRTYERIAERLRAVPGVESVGLGMVNLSGVAGRAPLYVHGRPVDGFPPVRLVRSIGPGYFETMGNPVIAGRTVQWADVLDLRSVAVISENLAREYWDAPTRALGQRIALLPEGPWQEIVGVVGDVRANGLNQPAPSLVYLPMADAEGVSRSVSFAVRSNRVGTAAFMGELQRGVWEVQPAVPLANSQTLAELHAESMSQASFATILLAVAAAGALILALVGVYGVVSYIAVGRTREIGIRMALGAETGDIGRLFLRYGLGLTAAGIVLGLGGALLVTPLMSGLLYGVGPTDLATYVGVALGLGAVTVIATYVPARRASHVPPIVALRSEGS